MPQCLKTLSTGVLICGYERKDLTSLCHISGHATVSSSAHPGEIGEMTELIFMLVDATLSQL